MLDPLISISKRPLASTNMVRPKAAAVDNDHKKYDDEAAKRGQGQAGQESQPAANISARKAPEPVMTPQQREKQMADLREFEAQQRRQLGI